MKQGKYIIHDGEVKQEKERYEKKRLEQIEKIVIRNTIIFVLTTSLIIVSSYALYKTII